MASALKQEYIEQYSELAMEQMRRYGIPASVTLAQAILESTYGTSSLSVKSNNHFGIKGTMNGQYVTATDNTTNEKFRKYDKVSESYEDHSKFLMGARYRAQTRNLSADDYEGWATGLQKAGYAYPPNGYANKLINEIQAYHLDKYDKMVMEQMQQEGKQFGVAQNPLNNEEKNKSTGMTLPIGNYSMPLKQSFLVETSQFGHRIIAGKSEDHKGIDLSCKENTPLFATEDGGKVVMVNNDPERGNGAGKYVTIEYSRADGSKDRILYMHMNNINVKIGDSVNAGTQIGLSGNTGRSMGPHLHFEVRHLQFGQKSDSRDDAINPEKYLAEINNKGGLQACIYKKSDKNNAHDLLADYRPSDSVKMSRAQNYDSPVDLTPEQYLKKLIASEHGFNINNLIAADSEQGLGGIAQIFMMLYQMMMEVDKKERDIVKDVNEKTIDVSGIVWSASNAKLTMHDNGRMVLQAEQQGRKIEHTLTVQESHELTAKLSSQNIDGQTKRDVLGNMLSGIISTQSIAEQYNESLSQDQNQQLAMQRKQ